MKNSQKALLIISLLSLLTGYLSQCMRNGLVPDKRGNAFAPEQTCRQCHQSIVDSALLTAHYNASFAADTSPLSPFSDSAEAFYIFQNAHKVVVENRDSGWYQVWFAQNKVLRAQRFDVGFGYTHALTWLYWQNEQAYELPLSWYRSVQRWGTSPGYPASEPYFNRLIGVDCFECHSSHITRKQNSAAAGDYFSASEPVELLDKSSLLYGINCQRCHGPAGEHVAFHEQHPGDSVAHNIVQMGKLSRRQSLDACGLCHSGNSKPKLKSRFAFRPGDVLADFFLPGGNAGNDVHGNQLGLLQQSKCFLKSSNLTCGSCHKPHSNARETLATSSQQCMSCHSPGGTLFCTIKKHSKEELQRNCIDCHMPRQASDAITYYLQGQPEPLAYKLRTHKIAVY